MKEPRGGLYNSTVGKIIKYNQLAKFIDELLREREIFPDAFVDIPCGTGKLLNCFNKINNKIQTLGCDISSEQLHCAKSSNPNSTFFSDDIFNFFSETTTKPMNLFCHIGFCFFNTLKIHDRNTLMNLIFNDNSIKFLGFEIQNTIYQKENFKENVWHKTLLGDTKTLLSRSVIRNDNSRELDLHFFDRGKLTQKSSAVLYDWEINDCLEFCNFIGWKKVQYFPATYRDNISSTSSHWYVLCAKEL